MILCHCSKRCLNKCVFNQAIIMVPPSHEYGWFGAAVTVSVVFGWRYRIWLPLQDLSVTCSSRTAAPCVHGPCPDRAPSSFSASCCRGLHSAKLSVSTLKGLFTCQPNAFSCRRYRWLIFNELLVSGYCNTGVSAIGTALLVSVLRYCAIGVSVRILPYWC